MMRDRYPYRLTIIIPTKNRQQYCIGALNQILNDTNKDVQIVIQDNSNEPEIIKTFCDKLHDTRVFYHYNDRNLSFVDNFSEAVSFAQGRYVCMIGDDDGILPRIMDVLTYSENNDLDCFIPGLNVVYFWPSTPPVIKGAENGYEYISYLNKEIRDVDVLKSKERLLKRGFQDYQTLDVPRLYHGLVHQRVLERIKEKAGKYFDGLTPDMFMAVALCYTVKKACAQDYPITVSGICPQSGSSASATGAHTGSLKDAPHFNGHVNYKWDNLIPYIYTVETIWAETGLQAVRVFDDKDRDRHIFDRIYLYSRLWEKYKQFHKEISTKCKEENLSVAKIRLKAVQIHFSRLFTRFIKRITRKKTDLEKFYDLTDMSAAATVASDNLSR